MTTIDEAKALLVTASHILATNDVLDVFGHVSLRHPDRPDAFLLSCSKSPEFVEAGDVIAFDLACRPLVPDDRRLFMERVIHGAIYRARPDVNAVAHFHAPAIMPFCATGVAPRPVTHVGAVMGEVVPFWSAQEAFGDTNMLVSTQAQGDSLAAALGPNACVLLRNHGGVATGGSAKELVFRAITLCRNATVQLQAALLGTPSAVTPGEATLSAKANLSEPVLDRAWTYWTKRLGR